MNNAVNLKKRKTDIVVPPSLKSAGVVRISGDGTQFNAVGWIVGPKHIAELEAGVRGVSLGRYLQDAAQAVAAAPKAD